MTQLLNRVSPWAPSAEISNLLGVEESTLSEFAERDPYNDTEVAGYICRQSDHRYGALVITTVDGVATRPQIIYCTPKLKYPFGRIGDDGIRRYDWPKHDSALWSEKIDGTAICAFSYANGDGARFLSFKTRLTPFLRKSQFGDFKGMWDEILDSNKWNRDIASRWNKIWNGVLFGAYTLTFELYGYRNMHLMKYDVALDAKLLFQVGQEFQDVQPGDSAFGWSHYANPMNSVQGDLTKHYEDSRERMQAKMVRNDDGSLSGSEGVVYYIHLTEDIGYGMYKCKPEIVENIHWTSDTIPYNSILSTVWNSLENTDTPTVELISDMLLEEFDQNYVNKAGASIAKAIAAVREILDFRQRVLKLYLERTPEERSKGVALRALSACFERKEMTKVYNALVELGRIDP